MKVLLVNGSPHKEGCTYTALQEVSKQLNQEGIETEIFWIGKKAMSGCIACKTCVTKHACVFDDKVNEFLDIAGDFDGFLLVTPFLSSVATGSMTSFLDRVFYTDFCGERNNFYLKPAAAIMSARRAGTTATWDQMNKYFGLMEMPIVTSRYWNMVHGATPEQVKQDEEGMQVMRILAKNMAFFLKCKEAGLKAGVSYPEKEQITFTNFIR